MRKLGKALGRILLVVLVLGGMAWVTAPEEPVDRRVDFDPAVIGPDIPAYLAASEARFGDIRPGVEKRVSWAGAPGVKTPIAVVYVHGFSATSEEIRPVPDRVAAALGANLYFTRLTGHGRAGDAMAEATAGGWIEDMAEAMAIGRRIGERVLVISTSTGATLAAIAATDPVLSEGMAGVILVSPNFGIANPAAKILDLPWARVWGPLLAGERRSFPPSNPAHGQFWTTDYPTLALFPMAALIREAKAQDYARATLPVLLIYSPNDSVIDVAAIPAIRDAWGGPVQEEQRIMGPGDDPNSHVIAGDILSPGQTGPTVDLILAWARGLE